MILRCAAYARYSSDLQSPLSIEDQLRICREYARSHGFVFLEDHVYVDEALSGVGADRPGLGRLMDAALSPSRPFDVILLDDSSRLARNTKDALSIFERLNFAGIRLIAVSQGIDSDNEQAQVLVTVHGMVDSLYVKELAKKTHRGLEGLVLRGQHATGTIRSRSMAQQESNWSSTRAKRKSFAAFSRCRPTASPSRPLRKL